MSRSTAIDVRVRLRRFDDAVAGVDSFVRVTSALYR